MTLHGYHPSHPGELLARRREQARRSVSEQGSKAASPTRLCVETGHHFGRYGRPPPAGARHQSTPPEHTTGHRVCMRPQVWEHASVDMIERLAAAPEVQKLVARLATRAAAGEISVSQAGSATVDHLVKFTVSSLASRTSEPI